MDSNQAKDFIDWLQDANEALEREYRSYTVVLNCINPLAALDLPIQISVGADNYSHGILILDWADNRSIPAIMYKSSVGLADYIENSAAREWVRLHGGSHKAQEVLEKGGYRYEHS